MRRLLRLAAIHPKLLRPKSLVLVPESVCPKPARMCQRGLTILGAPMGNSVSQGLRYQQSSEIVAKVKRLAKISGRPRTAKSASPRRPGIVGVS